MPADNTPAFDGFDGYHPDGDPEPIKINSLPVDLHITAQIEHVEDEGGERIGTFVDLDAYDGDHSFIQIPAGEVLELELPTGHEFDASLRSVQFEHGDVLLWFTPA